MKILSFDISSKTGWALLEGDRAPDAVPSILERGRVTVQDLGFESVIAAGQYPWSFIDVARAMAGQIVELTRKYEPDHIVIEDTSESKNRFAQKLLEWIHFATLTAMLAAFGGLVAEKLTYVQVGSWRSTLDLRMSKADKKNNASVSAAKRAGVSKASLGLKGKVTKKHLALRFVEEKFKLKLKVKDNDIADSICLGTAYLRGARPSEGLHGRSDE